MNLEIAKLWTDALRSGEYTQTIGSLQDDVGNCCLGVLCRLAIKHGVKLEVFCRGGATLFDECDNVLPGAVRRGANMDSNSGKLPDGDALDYINDRGATFPEIADIIEQKADEL